jgi:type I restriction enzyme M protein
VALTTDQLKKYWDTANVLRKNLDAAEYKHIVLGLVFLKYVSDSFSERREELSASFSDPKSDRYKPDAKRLQAALDDRNYYKEVNVFWVPESSRWEVIQEHAKQADIASMVDNALYEIEKENPKLEGIVERRYADAKLPAADLGAVIDLIGSISFGNGRHEASDVLGQVYEYFLGMFASAEGKLGGQFYTTPSIVKTLVEVLQPTSGRVYDPCCGSGGMFVQSIKFIEAHNGNNKEISIYGQEYTNTTYKLAKMNLAIRGISGNLGEKAADTFADDQHKDLKADFIMANPPFNQKDWTVSKGTVNDNDEKSLSLSMFVVSGQSGSPVLNDKNQVVGVISQASLFCANPSTPKPLENAVKLGCGFAIPIDRVRERLREWGTFSVISNQ